MLWENMAGDNHYLSIELEGVWANRNGIGSRITCHAGGKVFQRYTHAGENFLGQDSGKEIFRLDSIAMVDSLIIQWNSGTRDVFVNLNADQLLHVREGDSLKIYPRSPMKEIPFYVLVILFYLMQALKAMFFGTRVIQRNGSP